MILKKPRDYTLLDPRQIAAQAPYTYFIPDHAELDAITVGDLVQLVFEYTHDTEEWAAERMWVAIWEIAGDQLTGTLDNEPFETTTSLAQGDEVRFERFHIIDIVWLDPERAPEFATKREYWERCMVDSCVLEGERPVGYLYREEPDLTQDGDTYPDSGWRIRGRFSDDSQDEIEGRNAHYVALGAVLNQDDSWLHLVDEPVGSKFVKDDSSGKFRPRDKIAPPPTSATH